MGVSNRIRRTPKRRTGWSWRLLLLVALSVAAGGRGTAQDPQDRDEFLLDAPADRAHAIATRHGLTILRGPDNDRHGLFLVRGRTGESHEQLVSRVAGDPEVHHFESNTLALASEVPSGISLNQSPLEILDSTSDRSLVEFFGEQAWSRYANQPATRAIRLEAAHATVTGAGIVAIIDTGVDATHPMLAGALVPGYDFVNDIAGQASEWNDLDSSTTAILNQSPLEILDSASSPVPVNQSTVVILNPNTAEALNTATLPAAFGHGTMVAGLVHLVAPTAKIMPLKAFRADGSARVFDIVRAIRYAADNGARVINMSFSTVALSPEVTHAINYATDLGVICVSSAGNAGKEMLVYPAALRNVLGVGSTNSADPPARSAFSNYGESLVGLGAPGAGVITTYPGGKYAGAWGTSFSTALVSGAAALLLQKDPTLDQQTASDFLGRADRMRYAGMGRGRLNLFNAVRHLADEVAPMVAIVTPSGGSTVQGTVTIATSAADNVSVAGVKLLVNNLALGVEDTAAPYQFNWNTTAVANGNYGLTAVARDAEGNRVSSSLTVAVANDSGAPTVSLTSPAAGTTVSGAVTLAADATGVAGLASVRFFVDGVALDAADVTAPYELTWVTTTAANGTHSVTAVARDASGNEATSAAVTVAVSNDSAPTVSLTGPGAGTTVSGTVTLVATATDDIAVTSVEFFVDGVPLGVHDTAAPYEGSWNTTALANGSHELTAVARDAAGHDATSAAVTVTVSNDSGAPTVSLTGPGAGTTVSGTVTLVATATDDIAVTSVQFFVDGIALGVHDTAAPYEGSWNTTALANGSPELTAVARDAAGHTATTAAVTVTVANDSGAPTVSLTRPGTGTAVSGTVTLAATATDDIGVTSVQFFVDGVPLGAADVDAPYELLWPTAAAAANGSHVLTAVARDAAGHDATAAAVTVSV